jgi:hypothetical protein
MLSSKTSDKLSTALTTEEGKQRDAASMCFLRRIFLYMNLDEFFVHHCHCVELTQ